MSTWRRIRILLLDRDGLCLGLGTARPCASGTQNQQKLGGASRLGKVQATTIQPTQGGRVAPD
jgi:hypothetical protein